MSETTDITMREYKDGTVSVHRNGHFLYCNSWVREGEDTSVKRFENREYAFKAIQRNYLGETVTSETILKPEVIQEAVNVQKHQKTFSDWLVDKIENFFGIKDRD